MSDGSILHYLEIITNPKPIQKKPILQVLRPNIFVWNYISITSKNYGDKLYNLYL